MPQIYYFFCSWLNNNEVHGTSTYTRRQRWQQQCVCMGYFYCFRDTMNIFVGIGWLNETRVRVRVRACHKGRETDRIQIQCMAKTKQNKMKKNRIGFLLLFLSWLQNHFSCNTNKIVWSTMYRRRRDKAACTCQAELCIWYAATALLLLLLLQNTALHRSTTKCFHLASDRRSAIRQSAMAIIVVFFTNCV